MLACTFVIQDDVGLYRLWFHECCRVFEDRLVNNEDRDWFEDLLRTKVTSELGVSMDEVLPRGLPIYGDFANPNSDAKNYEEITDISKVCVCAGVVDECCLSPKRAFSVGLVWILVIISLDMRCRDARVSCVIPHATLYCLWCPVYQLHN